MVDVAMTGQEALQMFKPGEYDLVLLDIHLPDMTGFDISRKLRPKEFDSSELPPLITYGTANVLKDKKVFRRWNKMMCSVNHFLWMR